MSFHIWRTDRLVQELATKSLSQEDSAKYMMASAVLYLQSTYAATWFGGFHSWVLIAEFFMVLAIALVGVRECYRANGGAQGQDFILRYCAISVPIGVKMTIAGIFIGQVFNRAFPYIVTPETFGDAVFVFRFFGFVYALSFAFIFYWRIAFHLSALSGQRASPAAELTA